MTTSIGSTPRHSTTPLNPVDPGPKVTHTLLPYTFDDLSGPGCTGNPVDTELSSDHKGDGWHKAIDSHPNGNPCGPDATWTRLANLGADTWQDNATWLFDPGAARTCQFNIFIPEIPQATGIATYDVYSGNENDYSGRQTFVIRQSYHQGQWLLEGPFTLPHRPIYLYLTDRSTTDGTIAVSTVHVYCH